MYMFLLVSLVESNRGDGEERNEGENERGGGGGVGEENRTLLSIILEPNKDNNIRVKRNIIQEFNIHTRYHCSFVRMTTKKSL
jgi:hypothetical protein